MKPNRFAIVEKDEIAIAEQVAVAFVEGNDWEFWSRRRGTRKKKRKKKKEEKRKERHGRMGKKKKKKAKEKWRKRRFMDARASSTVEQFGFLPKILPFLNHFFQKSLFSTLILIHFFLFFYFIREFLDQFLRILTNFRRQLHDDSYLIANKIYKILNLSRSLS